MCGGERSARGRKKDVCVVQDLGGQQCVCCAARDKNVVEGVDEGSAVGEGGRSKLLGCCWLVNPV